MVELKVAAAALAIKDCWLVYDIDDMCLHIMASFKAS